MCVVHIVKLMCVYDSLSSSLQVTGICFLKQKIIVGGWNRQLAMYRCVYGEVCVRVFVYQRPLPLPSPLPSPKPNCSLNPTCRDTYESDDLIPKYWGAGVHQDDILCLNHQEPNFLASGGYDGEIAVWNMDVEKPVCRLNASSLTGASAAGGSRQSQPPQDLCTSDGHLEGEEDGDGDGERGGEEKSTREAAVKRRGGKDERAVEKVRKYTDICSQ